MPARVSLRGTVSLLIAIPVLLAIPTYFGLQKMGMTPAPPDGRELPGPREYSFGHKSI